MLIAGRSSGRPTRVLRTDEVTNSSSSLATCFDRPLISVPAACAALSDPFPVPGGTPFTPRGSAAARLSDCRLTNAVKRCALGSEPAGLAGQDGVAEEVDGVRDLGGDRRIEVGQAAEEGVDQRLDLAGELLEHEVLILHLGAEARRLEDALAVAPARTAVDGVPVVDFRL